MTAADDLAALPGVADLIERSRALGAEVRMVVHGGGNTSAKTGAVDHLGRTRPVMVIKASGAELRTNAASGFVALYLDELVTARAAAAMDDEAMTRFLAACRADLSPRRPSIETLLHAFLPAAHVDHVHADAICALTNGPRPAETVRECLGDRVAYVPYRRPGFVLAREVAEHAGAEAVVLGHHGLVTWGDDSAALLDLTRRLVECAERYLAERGRGAGTGVRARELSAAEAEAVLVALRGRVSHPDRRVLQVDPAGRTFTDRADVQAIIDAGPATADHLLRLRAFPILVRSADAAPAAVDAAERRAADLWTRNQTRAPDGTVMRDARPVLALVPGLGTVGSGATAADARAVIEVAARTHAVAATVIDAFQSAVPLADEDLFDLEYWPLELAKLVVTRPRDLESRVIVVTGAASGIGRDVATAIAVLGAHVALADIDLPRLEEVAAAITTAGGNAIAVRADVTDVADIDELVRAAVREWGGIDGIVSNAGVAVTGRIEDLSTAEWDRSIAINVRSHFLLARRVLPVLRTQGLGGSLVFIASKNAFSPGDGFGAYSVAKAAEVQLARILAIEGGPIGVRSNVVNPDAVFGGSRLWEHGLREDRATAHGVPAGELERFYAARSLLGVEVRGSDVAEAVAFLLSDRASRTTGAVVTVDGGVAAAFPR